MSANVLTAGLFALLIGVIAGLRTMTAPAAVSWAAQSGVLVLGGTWLAFLGYAWTSWILSCLALVEFVGDQLPSTPSRTEVWLARSSAHLEEARSEGGSPRHSETIIPRLSSKTPWRSAVRC